MKIIFFGAGKYAYNAYQQVLEKPYLFKDDYLAFADNNMDLWGTDFCNVKVISPCDICKKEYDAIVISSIYKDSIHRQLTEELGIATTKIYFYEEYKRKCYAQWIYEKRYSNIDCNKHHPLLKKDKIVIYTAITGNYDTLKDPLFQADGLTYVCLTNNPDMKSNIWNMEYIKDDSRDNVHLARHLKMNPHIFFKDFEISVWVDGKYQILDDMRKYIALYGRGANILCFPHPERECICDELGACITYGKGTKQDMILQVSDYLKGGYPLGHGLYETGCMVRSHNDKEVQMLMRNWENELLKYSIRDQLSFPYVCWKYGYLPDICDLDINRNNWLLQKRELRVLL